MSKQSYIYVKFQKEGIHCYPAALTDPSLNTKDDPKNSWLDVSFLGHPHRHIFFFKVWISVDHSDRAIEFIQFKRWLENLYSDDIINLHNKSCEMICEDLYNLIIQKYPGHEVWIDVSEDNENGAFLKFVP